VNERGAPDDQAPRLDQALAYLADRLRECSDSPRLDAEVLAMQVLERPRAALYGHPEYRLGAREWTRIVALGKRRAAGEPTAYLVGRREFWSLDLEVTPATLVPRPDTELLVEIALAHLAPGRTLAVADLGTGCGAIALAIASERPMARVVATDLDAAALDVARRNVQRLGLANLSLRPGDWCAALGARRFDLIVSNPPYVRDGDPCLDPDSARYEPPLALAGGRDGLRCIARLADQARDHLLAGGHLMFEHGFDQAAAVAELLARLGYRAPRAHRDAAGHERVTAAQWPAASTPAR